MIGTGDSQKLPDVEPDTYSFQTHRDHVEAFIEAVIDPSEKILFVIHDWGSAYGFDWANRHRDRVRGFAYMESIVRPYASWDEWGALQPLFQAFRSPEGERLILEENTFVEQVLFGSIPKLTEAEYAEYRRPFLKNEDRWPTLKWPRSIPIAGAPADVVEIVQSYATWMAENELPKLSSAQTRRDPDWCATRVRPQLEEPDRDPGRGPAFRPGERGQADRQVHRRLDRPEEGLGRR